MSNKQLEEKEIALVKDVMALFNIKTDISEEYIKRYLSIICFDDSIKMNPVIMKIISDEKLYNKYLKDTYKNDYQTYLARLNIETGQIDAYIDKYIDCIDFTDKVNEKIYLDSFHRKIKEERSFFKGQNIYNLATYVLSIENSKNKIDFEIKKGNIFIPNTTINKIKNMLLQGKRFEKSKKIQTFGLASVDNYDNYKPYIAINNQPFLLAPDEYNNKQLILKLLDVIFHEYRHIYQQNKLKQNVIPTADLLFVIKEIYVSEYHATYYEENYSRYISFENSAKLIGKKKAIEYIKLLKIDIDKNDLKHINKDYSYNVSKSVYKDTRLHKGKLYDKDDLMDMIIPTNYDTFITFVKRFPILQYQYNLNGVAKSASELNDDRLVQISKFPKHKEKIDEFYDYLRPRAKNFIKQRY